MERRCDMTHDIGYKVNREGSPGNFLFPGLERGRAFAETKKHTKRKSSRCRRHISKLGRSGKPRIRLRESLSYSYVSWEFLGRPGDGDDVEPTSQSSDIQYGKRKWDPTGRDG